MLVRDGMSSVVLSIGPAHTLREASRLMAKRRVGSAVVVDPDTFGIGILTERDSASGKAYSCGWSFRASRCGSTPTPPGSARSWTGWPRMRCG